MQRILVIEDDHIIAEAIRTRLLMFDYDVICLSGTEDVLHQFYASDPHLVLMDVTLPFKSGFYWCSEIRKISKVPIIFISSVADNMNMVLAMNMGADDFIAKPFDLGVFTAKIQAILRRAYSFAGQLNILEHRGAILNLSDATLSYCGNKSELSKNDFKLLQILMESPGEVISREDIMLRLWESDHFIDDNTLTVNVTRLRKKLEDIGLEDFILTKKGLGYYLNGR